MGGQLGGQPPNPPESSTSLMLMWQHPRAIVEAIECGCLLMCRRGGKVEQGVGVVGIIYVIGVGILPQDSKVSIEESASVNTLTYITLRNTSTYITLRNLKMTSKPH